MSRHVDQVSRVFHRFSKWGSDTQVISQFSSLLKGWYFCRYHLLSFVEQAWLYWENCFFLWPTFLFTHVTQGDSACSELSLSAGRYTASHLPKQRRSMVSCREAVAWRLVLHCALHPSPDRDSHLILHVLSLWTEPSPDAHCRSDRELFVSGYFKLEQAWENSSDRPCNSTQ